jgi:methenyltetrahydromethanopterin cyclohydrolase
LQVQMNELFLSVKKTCHLVGSVLCSGRIFRRGIYLY